jgi:hypothetical protein
MPGFNTLPVVGGGGGQANMTFVASIHMNTYNRRWTQGGTPGYYAMYSTNQENGYAYFVGTGTTTGVPLNRLANISHSFTRIDVIAPQNDMVSLYKAKVKATTEFPNAFDGFSSFPSTITSSGNFVLPNNALPLVNVLAVGGGGTAYHHGGGGGGGGVVKLTAYQAVGTTSVTIGAGRGGNGSTSPGGATFFGNVYAIGGGSATSHDSDPTANGANGGGASGFHGQNRNGANGITQTSSTGLGVTGSPAYHGGFKGGDAHPSSSSTHRHLGGGGGGAAGAGTNKYGGSGGVAGGAGHYSDINGAAAHYGPGGGGSDHHGNNNNGAGSGFYAHSGTLFGQGGNSEANGHSNGASGAVIVRYYIP